jgi:hypothetical protein
VRLRSGRIGVGEPPGAPLRVGISPTRALGLVLLLLLLPALAWCAPDDEVRAVIDAVRFAYGLEAEYWRDPSAFSSYEQLYAHYRQGFSPELAAAMASHTLTSNGDPATWVPKRVQVAELSTTKALVWFITPAEFGKAGFWGLEDYMLLRLRRDGGRWVVYWGDDRSSPPVR